MSAGSERVELAREDVVSKVEDLSARLEAILKKNQNFRDAAADQYWNKTE